MLVATIVSLGRQRVDPVGLQTVTVVAKGLEHPATGALVARTGDAVYVGDLHTKRVRVIRMDDVKRLSIGPPLQIAPKASLLSRWGVIDGKWSLVPVALWCDSVRYGLGHLGTACRTQASVGSPTLSLDLRWVPITVRCPDKAGDDGCSGYARLRTVKPYGSEALGPGVAARQVDAPQRDRKGLRFRVAAGSRTLVCVPVSDDLRYLLSSVPAEGDAKPDMPVSVDVLLSTDTMGKSLLRTARADLKVPRPGEDPSMIPAGSCSADFRHSLARPPGTGEPLRVNAKVARVVDGDTLEVVVDDGTVQRIRIIGIDAPESNGKGGPACGEKAARAFVKALIPSSGDVVLEADRRVPARDGASRPLRYVWVARRGGEVDLGAAEVRAGWAKAPTSAGSRFSRAAAHAKAAQAAEKAQTGRWSLCRANLEDGMTQGPVPGA
jgi:micrococcal nuclease